jgi:hypothetical protein
MMSTTRVAFVAFSALLVAACAAEKATPPPPTVATTMGTTEKGGIRQQEVTVRAIVEKVDVKERLVTLRGPDGTTETIRLPADVRNLPQVKKGDEVIASYYQSIAFEVVKKSDAKLGVSAEEGGARAQLGEKPGAVGARVVTIVADVVKLDREAKQAVLKGADGKTTTVNVHNPAAFDKVKVGDRVEIKLTEAVGIDVQPAAKK